MGHSTSSGRTGGGGAAQERTVAQANPLPRGVASNSRLGRAWRTAQGGDATVAVREYDEEIRRETDRMRNARNTFVKQTAQQTIDRLREEKRRIERAFLD